MAEGGEVAIRMNMDATARCSALSRERANIWRVWNEESVVLTSGLAEKKFLTGTKIDKSKTCRPSFVLGAFSSVVEVRHVLLWSNVLSNDSFFSVPFAWVRPRVQSPQRPHVF